MAIAGGALVLAGCGMAAAATDDAANPARLGAWKLAPPLVSLNVDGQTIPREQLTSFRDVLDGDLGGENPFAYGVDSLRRDRSALCYEPGKDAVADARQVLPRAMAGDCTVTNEIIEGATKRAVLKCPFELRGKQGVATVATTARLSADASDTEMRVELAAKQKTGATEMITLRFEVDGKRTGDCGAG
jgi:hypothetical protein